MRARRGRRTSRLLRESQPGRCRCPRPPESPAPAPRLHAVWRRPQGSCHPRRDAGCHAPYACVLVLLGGSATLLPTGSPPEVRKGRELLSDIFGLLAGGLLCGQVSQAGGSACVLRALSPASPGPGTCCTSSLLLTPKGEAGRRTTCCCLLWCSVPMAWTSRDPEPTGSLKAQAPCHWAAESGLAHCILDGLGPEMVSYSRAAAEEGEGT